MLLLIDTGPWDEGSTFYECESEDGIKKYLLLHADKDHRYMLYKIVERVTKKTDHGTGGEDLIDFIQTLSFKL